MSELMVIALPMVVSQGCETMMMCIDRLFLSRLGPEYMSAALGGGLTCFMFMTFFIGLTGYTTALVAQYLGAKQAHNCPKVVTQALLIAIFAYPVVLLGIPLGHLLFRLTGIAPAQLIPQRVYFDILMFGTIFGLLRNALSCFFSGIGRTRVVMLGAGISLVVNVALNYVLIFGKLGLPAMGIKGAAIGTLGGSIAGLLFVACYYFGKRFQHEYDVRGGLRYNGDIMRKLLRLGSPSGVEFFLNIMAFNLLVMNFHSYGVNVAAAVTITFNWDMVSFIPLVGVGIGVTSLVGRYMGAGKPAIAHRATMSGLKFAAAYSAVAFVAFMLFPQPLVGLFHPADNSADFPQIMQLAIFMVRLISVYVFADAVAIVFGGALRGAGDTFWTMCISVFGHWILALTAMAMIHLLHAPPRITWLLMVVMILFLGGTLYLRYRSGKWRGMRVVVNA